MMNATADFLIELGTEELPPTGLRSLRDAFAQGVHDRLEHLQLAHGRVKGFATPRRLAVMVESLAANQPEQTVERRGPALAAAFDADGHPTRAAEGFARSCGVTVANLEHLQTDKGTWLVYRARQSGGAAVNLLPALIEETVRALPVARRMHWGTGKESFVRPVHWVVALFGHEVLDVALFGVHADRITRGHRFHHPDPIIIPHPAAYSAELADPGHVIADFDQRREIIRNQIEQVAREVEGTALMDADLLDEVTGLVEWPAALAGRFEDRFLALPREVLVATLQGHQRYFPVVGGDGALLPAFITVANIRSRRPQQVRIGNERVVRPRLADALFFWEQDRQRPLAAFTEGLDHLAFQRELGSMADKTQRVRALAAIIAPRVGADAELADRAAELSKADLMTAMVYEFTELQGVMGRYYAALSGEDAQVAQALEEQYHPRHAGDELPRTKIGQTLALAERLDTLAGIFAIGRRPSGEKDPFALRRAALGIIRILVEQRIDLDLTLPLEAAVAQQPGGHEPDDVVAQLREFLLERMRSYYAAAGVPAEIFAAVAAIGTWRLLDFDRRLKAVQRFLALPQAESLAAAHKRIRNILKQAGDDVPQAVSLANLHDDAERELERHARELATVTAGYMESGDYEAALRALAALQAPVDRFFDQVMVMIDDPAVRRNRLALLGELDRLCRTVADISCLPG